MATVLMDQRQGRMPGYEYTANILDGVTGPSIIIQPIGYEGGRVTCTIIPGGNTGKFQFTTSPDADVLADSATWQDWPNGDTSVNFSDSILAPVTAVRGVSVSGAIDIEVLI